MFHASYKSNAGYYRFIPQYIMEDGNALLSYFMFLYICVGCSRFYLCIDSAPPRPPLPMGDGAPMRPPPPETDDEDDVFKNAPNASQPIMVTL